MIVERGSSIDRQPFIAQIDTAPDAGRLLIDALRSPARLLRLPSEIARLRRRTNRRADLRRVLEAVHLGWDLSVEPGQAHLPDPSELGPWLDWLSQGDNPLPAANSPVMRAVGARVRELPGLVAEMKARLSEIRSNAPLFSPPNGSVLLYVTHVDFPHRLSGYTRRSDAIIRALEMHGITVRRINTADLIDGMPRLAKTGQDLSAQFVDAGHAFATRIGGDVGAIIAASDWRTGWIARLASAALNRPFAYELRGFWELSHAAIHPEYVHTPAFAARLGMERALASQSDYIFTLSALMAERLTTQTPTDLVPNGTTLRDDAVTQPTRGSHNQKSGALRLGYVGSLNDYEGLSEFVDALHLARKQGARAQLEIIGAGAAKGAIAAAIRTHDASSIVTMTGALPPEEAKARIGQFDAVVLPRKDYLVCQIVEPLKPFEALAAACPVLATPLPVLEGVPGIWRADGFDAPSLAQLILAADRDRHRLQALGRAGQDYVRAKRQWVDVTAPMARWVHQALSDASSP